MRLIKKADGWYNLYDGEIGIGSTHEELQVYKLSKENCDDIFGVVDVEKLAEEFVNDLQIASETVNRSVKLGYDEGFNKAIELNKDKVFTLEQVIELAKILISNPYETSGKTPNELIGNFIQSIQKPTEIEVDIQMECETGCNNFIFNGNKSICCGNKRPKLDDNNNLILRRI
jgi:hypothetical protein